MNRTVVRNLVNPPARQINSTVPTVQRPDHPPQLVPRSIFPHNKMGQVTVFIVVAVFIVGLLVLYFVLRDTVGGEDNIPKELAPVYDFYRSCIEMETKLAIQLAGSRGGHLLEKEYFPGSEYAPFSSHLNFFGTPVPYWYYVSANGVIKENVPSQSDIEREMEEFIEDGLLNCNLEPFYKDGFEIDLDEPNVQVDIRETRVDVVVSAEMIVTKEDDAARKTIHKTEVASKFGKFYNLAREIYDKEKIEAFLEDYAVDVLYLYAPVDGVLLQCGPAVWSTQNVMNDLRYALEQNFMTLKFEGGDYELKGKDREYFILDKEVDEQVDIMYLRDWPTKIEITGEGLDDEVMISEAVGAQEGMGAMGFCYVPYHYVYDVSFPALIQIYNVEELFQFPVAVVIDNNMPREGLIPSIINEERDDFDLCEFKTQPLEVNIYDVNLNGVDANVSYGCFDQECRIGQSVDGRLVSNVPGCVNGFLSFEAEGYERKSELFSSNRENYLDVILEREFEVKVEVEIGGNELDGTAIVSFTRDDGKSRTIALPQQGEIKLSEGNYEIRVYVYGDSNIVLPATTKRECVRVSKGGLLGLFGSTEEKCFDIVIPETNIEFALIGGGNSEEYVLESELEKGSLILKVQSLPSPNSIEELAENFELFETRRVYLEFS